MTNNICKLCGKPFKHKRSKTMFCSPDCQNNNLSAIREGRNNPHYNNGWRQYRKYKQELIICENCGRHEPLEVHHKDGNRGNNGDLNLIRVCRRCHMFLDGRFINLTYGHSEGVNANYDR